MLEKLTEHLENQDRMNAVTLCLTALENGEITLPVLYENVLAPALNRIDVHAKNEAAMIWREHMMSSIVRSIVESCYPHVIKERERMGLKTDESVLVFCPRQEEHEIGARMIADFYTIWGYNTVFIGANTPENTLLHAIGAVKPRYLSVSVSNYFNLFAAKNLIAAVRDRFHHDVTVVAGGHAFLDNPQAFKMIGADYLLFGFEDIGKLRTGKPLKGDE